MSGVADRSPPAAGSRSGSGGRLSLAVIFLTAVGVRVWGAWVSRYITDFDSSVVALMARHMAEGRGWPVFFYGQHYMGSLEPAVSAGLVRLLGPTGFAVCLGPALVAVAALATLYAWAKDAGGPTAARAATALCVIGPAGYFWFQFAPRGGYMVALLASAFLLWKSGRLAVRSRAGGNGPGGDFFLLGLAAGLGLWSHPIIVSAAITAVLSLLIGWKGAFWRRPGSILAGLVGTVIGLAPWWIYNLTRGWPSLEILDNAGGVPIRLGIRLAWAQWIRMVGLYDWPNGLHLGVAAGYLVLAGMGMAVAVRDLAVRRDWDRSAAARLNGLLFIGISTLFLIRSRFVTLNTARYLLPIVPALALFAGLAIVRARHSWVRRVAAGIGLLILLSQTAALPELIERGRRVSRLRKGQEELRAALDAEGIRTLYAPLQAYPLNFMMGETITFSDSRKVFYGPYYEKAEFSDTPGFLKNHAGIAEFLAAGGGRAREAGPPGSRFHFDFSPPGDRLQTIPLTSAKSILFNGQPAPELADRHANTGRGPDFNLQTQTVEFRFARAVAPRRLRLEFAPPENLPTGFSVEIRDPETGDWQEVLPRQRATRFFWSGPRPFDGGRRQRMEFQLDGRETSAARVLLIDPDAERRPPTWKLTETDIFQSESGRTGGGNEVLPELLDLIEERGLQRVYADRWESNRIHLATGGRIAVELSPKLGWEGGLEADGKVHADQRTAFLVRGPDAGDTGRALREAGLAFREFAVEPWVLLVIDRAPDGSLPLYWTGYALRLNHSGPAGGSETNP